MSVQRIYHPYHKWEEYHHGMWVKIHGNKRDEYLKNAIEFTCDAGLYGQYMMKAVNDWPISCEQNLTCPSINKQAWIGQAACCIAIGCPEDIVREAWRMLSKEQQEEANKKADEAFVKWESKHIKNTGRQLWLDLVWTL